MTNKNILFYFLFIISCILSLLSSCSKPDPAPIEVWHEVGATGEPAFLNSWNNTGTGSKCSFMEDSDCFINLKGTISTTSITFPSTIFNLPKDYSSDTELTFTKGGVTVKIGAYVAGTGSVVTASASPVTLDGISFASDY